MRRKWFEEGSERWTGLFAVGTSENKDNSLRCSVLVRFGEPVDVPGGAANLQKAMGWRPAWKYAYPAVEVRVVVEEEHQFKCRGVSAVPGGTAPTKGADTGIGRKQELENIKNGLEKSMPIRDISTDFLRSVADKALALVESCTTTAEKINLMGENHKLTKKAFQRAACRLRV